MKKSCALGIQTESKMEQLRVELQIELRKSLENFRIEMIKMFDEMFVRKDHATDGKQEPEMMSGSDGEAQKNDLNLVMEEIDVITNEVGAIAQALIDTKTKG